MTEGEEAAIEADRRSSLRESDSRVRGARSRERRSMQAVAPAERGQLPGCTPEEEIAFAHSLERFGGGELPKVPRHRGQQLPLARLYREVGSRGGYDEVCARRLWSEVGRTVIGGADADPAQGNVAKQAYERCLLEYERTFLRKPRAPQQHDGMHPFASSGASSNQSHKVHSHDQLLTHSLLPSTGPIASLKLPQSGPVEHSLRPLLRQLDAHMHATEALNTLLLWTFDGLPEHMALETTEKLFAFASRAVIHENDWCINKCYRYSACPDELQQPTRKRRRSDAFHRSAEQGQLQRSFHDCFLIGSEAERISREPEATVACARNAFFTVDNPADLLQALGRHAPVLLADERTLPDCLDCMRAAFPHAEQEILTRPLLEGLAVAMKAAIAAQMPYADCRLESRRLLEQALSEEEQMEVHTVCAHATSSVHPIHLDKDEPLGDPRLIDDVLTFCARGSNGQAHAEACGVGVQLCKRSQVAATRLGANPSLLRDLATALQSADAESSHQVQESIVSRKAEMLCYASRQLTPGEPLKALKAHEGDLALCAATRSAGSTYAAKALYALAKKEREAEQQ